jgi:homoserine dehydrogenase
MTLNWKEVVEDPKVQVVVELAGGKTIARDMVMTALRLGKPVVTANKALISAYGQELFATAEQNNTNLYYEASVAGGIPIIKALREGFVGNRINSLYGIVNGTCNYILTRMKLEGSDFADVLKDAQKMGYAEAEPSLDVDGHDSVHKIGILASLAHGFWVAPEQIYTEGIRSISKVDIQFAAQLGYTIKLLGIVKMVKGGNTELGPRIQVSVYPALIPNNHVLAGINHVFNGVFVRGDIVGDTLFYGRGAGRDATASAVLSDIADAALDLKFGTPRRIPPVNFLKPAGSVVPMDEILSRFYVRMCVVDHPGVLAQIATIFGESKISISSVIQPEGHEGEGVPLIFMLHEASNAAMRQALGRIRQLSIVKADPLLLRVENL